MCEPSGRHLLRASALALVLATSTASLAGSGGSWYPSRYGAGDEAGASNLMTPAKVMQAVALIRKGQAVSLARTYEAGMPLFGQRVFALRGTSGLAGGPHGSNKVVWMDDFVSTEIGQAGTQFDGLAHIGIGGGTGMFYNGIPGSEVFGPYGVRRLGIERVKPFFTRGVVVNLEALKGRALRRGEEISSADIRGAMEAQGLSAITEGDVVILHTGWGRHWMKDNPTFNSGEPGIGMEAARYLIGRGVAVIASDAYAVEVIPNPDGNLSYPVHQETLTKNGVFLHENVASERLIAAGVSEFAYIFNPLPVKGATGSPGNALAVF